RDFKEAMAFLNRVAELAETANHHPDIWNSWNRVKLSLTTHDAGGLTERDFKLAKKIDAL
ncbi:MAG: 4a-hydroxytetrahydrobiopterin dehydratase, partial [Candidatus Thermoplasmatota archaeon]